VIAAALSLVALAVWVHLLLGRARPAFPAPLPTGRTTELAVAVPSYILRTNGEVWVF
jgi:hypothetical protein